MDDERHRVLRESIEHGTRDAAAPSDLGRRSHCRINFGNRGLSAVLDSKMTKLATDVVT